MCIYLNLKKATNEICYSIWDHDTQAIQKKEICDHTVT